MKYKITYIIDEKRDIVANLFVDRKHMKSWEVGLQEIEDIKGVLFETGSDGHLIFDFQGNQMKMKVYVESNQLPKEIVIIYQVAGAWNRCGNTFKSVNGKTEWTMDVEFRFNEPQNIGLEKFIEKTSKGMEIFRDYVESLRD